MKTQSSLRTVGLDLGDRKHSVCVLDDQGGILKEETITNTRASLTAEEMPSQTQKRNGAVRSRWLVETPGDCRGAPAGESRTPFPQACGGSGRS